MNRRMLFVIPECYVDTNFVEYLLDAGVNHQHSCSKVVGTLNGSFAGRFAVGIVDKDKVELGYIRECEEIARTAHLTLYKHPARHQYLVTISPAIEGFLLDCAEEQKVAPSSFGLPSDLKGFNRESKSVTSNKDIRFKRLFVAIRENPEIQSLKRALEYLCQNQYGTDSTQLESIFLGE